MAIRTVSNTGGNFNVAATWVGGIIPTNVDTIAFTATSGPLTIDDNSPIRGIDFTNYTNVFTIPNGSSFGLFLEDNGVTPAFVNLGTGGYTFVDGGSNNGFDLSNCSINPILTSSGINFPFLLTALFSGGATYINIVGTWNQSGAISSNTLYISGGTFTHTGSLLNVVPPYYFDISVYNNAVFNLVTTTDLIIYTNGDGTGVVNMSVGNVPDMIIQAVSSFNLTCNDIYTADLLYSTYNITCANITGNMGVSGTLNLLGTGTLPIPQVSIHNQSTSDPLRIDNLNFGSYTITEFFYHTSSGTSGSDVYLNLLSVLNCDKIYIRKTNTMLTRFLGSFGFVCNELIIDGGALNNIYIGAMLLESGTSYYVNTVADLRFLTSLSSTVPGVKANLTLGQNVNQNTIANVAFTDIDCSGGKRINNFYGTAINCDNIRIWNDNTLPQVCSTF